MNYIRKNWNYFVIGLIIVSGYALYYTNQLRTAVGFFEDPLYIFYNNIAYVVFFGLITGLVIGNIVDKTKGKR